MSQSRPGPPGVEANRRLTGLTGAASGVLLAPVILSGLVFGWSPGLHFFVGFAAIPVTLLKLASTGWRFLAYYVARSWRYRTAGPPRPLPRVLAPAVVASGATAFVTGVVLFFQGRDRGAAATLHTDSAVVFIVAVLLHAAIHLRATWEAAVDARGAALRRSLVIAATVAGVVLAVALVDGYHWTLLRRHLR